MTAPDAALPSDAEGVRPPSRQRSITSGALWLALGQAAPMGITLFLTPYILHGLGIVRYGLFVLTSTIVGFLNTLDGGIKGTAQRYFGVYAGAEDKSAMTRLLVTLLVVIAGFGVIVSCAGWFLAPPVVSLLTMPARYRSQTTFLVRTLGLLVTFSFIHNLFVAILYAHRRFPLIVKMGFVMNIVWAAGLVATVHYHWGLWGVTAVFLTQQLLLTLTIMPSAFRYLRWSDACFLRRRQLREFLSFGLRVQVANLSSLFNLEFDTITIGVALSVRATSIYNAGANYAQNVISLVSSTLPSAQAALANTFGRAGREETFAQYCRLQTVWVGGLTGVIASAGAAAWFAVTAWLGPDFSLGGFAALIVLVGLGAAFTAMVLMIYCTVIGEPGIQSRYGVLSVVVNIVLTVPMVLIGSLGVAGATAAGQLIGATYVFRKVRRKLHPELPSPLGAIPIVPAIVTAAVVVAGEAALRPLLPSGGLGLLGCTPPAGVGLLLYAALWQGPRTLARSLYRATRQARSAGIRAGVRSVLTSS